MRLQEPVALGLYWGVILTLTLTLALTLTLTPTLILILILIITLTLTLTLIGDQVEENEDFDHIVPMVGVDHETTKYVEGSTTIPITAVYFNDLHTNVTLRAHVSRFVKVDLTLTLTLTLTLILILILTGRIERHATVRDALARIPSVSQIRCKS